MDISNFWNSLDLLGKIYWTIAIPSSILFVIMLIMTIMGGDADHDVDADTDTDFDGDAAHGFGSYFFSLKTIIGFLTAASWTGIAGMSSKMMMWVVLVMSVSAGVLVMLIMAVAFASLSKLTYDGTMRFENALGATGEVYLTIPPKGQGRGKVQVKVQGVLRTLDAVTDEKEPIKTGTRIEVIDVDQDNILVVKKISE